MALSHTRLTARTTGVGARFYASKTTASPGQSSNVANPQSSSPESQAINVSRGKEARHDDTPDTRSVQSPISSQYGRTSEAHEGEERTSADAQIKNDPAESTETKRRNVEKAGERPLGPEDHQ
ncbi:uncharacterized protein BO97DRAFT_404524 [Aspergillus homomorphus CBS 101889]|uniref:Uncharacterized protein n=1 Tax=Aspergillus homomorphus (strain CBS 101889) TaxID=1450537 RepID=A0A395I4N5_ASPHC|nr:hypothetical protein BO97DRAFT_404524 [Aspergillus homomorphus CBS 101889]RAL14148.1 hypothetical protein BO97DRAFT_404524 [Aspergillus homomorphus CBS 101889]